MTHAMSSTCVASMMSEYHFGHSHHRTSTLDSIDEREYKKAVQVLRNFHRRGTARPLDVIHEEREGFNQPQRESVPQSPALIRRQIKAENLQTLLFEPPHQPVLDCGCGQLHGSGSAETEAAAAPTTATPCNESQRPPFQRSEAKASVSCSKPPLANRRSVRTKALLVWGRR